MKTTMIADATLMAKMAPTTSTPPTTPSTTDWTSLAAAKHKKNPGMADHQYNIKPSFLLLDFEFLSHIL